MKREFHLFFTALMFYTRIPCPSWVDHNEHNLNQSTKYFPLIGWIVGAVCGYVFWGSSLVLPMEISIILSITAGVMITGAFHEDGFADVCDGFGGGWTKEKILAIMKDSRIGTYGVVGLILLILIKISALVAIAKVVNPPFFVVIMISAGAISRLCAVTIIYFGEYSRDDMTGKARPVAKKFSLSHFIIAIIFGLLPLVYFNNAFYLTLFIPMLFAVLWMRKYFKKWIGGYTGDCLGAAQQLTEALFYISMLVLWKFI